MLLHTRYQVYTGIRSGIIGLSAALAAENGFLIQNFKRPKRGGDRHGVWVLAVVASIIATQYFGLDISDSIFYTI